MRGGNIAIALLLLAGLAGCSVAPPPEDRSDFLTRSIAQSAWFERNTPGLREKLRAAPAYIVFPDAAQWGTLIGGGQWARGAVFTPPRNHVGWVVIDGTSMGVQAGFTTCRMLIIVKDKPTFRALQLDMFRPGMAVAGVVGTGGAVRNPSFEEGFEIFIVDQTGLMAGVGAALQWIRYESTDEPPTPQR
jgi:lipid-binding SYLF domain-containing protein